jgi:hypothetical protein
MDSYTTTKQLQHDYKQLQHNYKQLQHDYKTTIKQLEKN